MPVSFYLEIVNDSLLMKYLVSKTKFLIFFVICCISNSDAQENKSDTTLTGDFYFNKGFAVYSTHLDSSIIYFAKARDQYKIEKKWSPFIDCHNALASLYYHQRDFEKYEQFALEAVEKSKLLLGPNDPKYSVALNNLDALYTEKGNYRKSIYYLKESLKIKENNQASKIEIAQTLQNLSTSFTLEGDTHSALKYAEKALDYLQESKEPNLLNQASALSAIGYTFETVNKLDSALNYYFKAIKILDKESIKKTLSWQKKTISAYQKTAEIFIQKNELSTAQDYLNKTLQLQKDDNSSRKPITFEKLAKIYLLQKKYAASEEAIRKSIALLETYNPNALTFIAIKETHLGDVFSHQGKLTLALEQYQSALTKLSGFTSIDSLNAESFLSKKESLITLHKKAETLHQLYTKTNDDKYLLQSYKSYILAIRLTRSMRIGFQTPESKNLLAENALPIYEASIQLAQKLYNKTGEGLYLKEAFQIAESNKALLLLESINEQSAKGIADIPDSLLNKDKDLRIGLAFYKKKLIEEKQKRSNKNSKIIKKWEDHVFSIDRQLDRLINQIEKNYPRYYNLKYQNQLVEISEIQNYLKKSNKAILEYFVGEKHIYLFIITSDKFEIKQIQNEHLVKQNVDTLKKILQNPPAKQFRNEELMHFIFTANDLYDQLIQPALDVLDFKTRDWIIIPDYYLNYIPFEILLRSNKIDQNGSLSHNNMEYLFEDFNISYDYSSTLHLKNKNRAKHKFKHNFAGFAPSFKSTEDLSSRTCANDNLYALKCSAAEVKGIKDIIGGDEFYGPDANREAFEKDIQNYKIIHLATHACIDEENSNLNKIFLTGDYLSDYDLYNMELDAELAVLSACNTGSGKLIKGEGVMSLARGFMNAGCASTVMSMWSVDDCATSEIMTYFYEGLKDGLSKDKALKVARIKYLNTVDKSKMHPYYWAAFVPFGDMEPLELGSKFPIQFYMLFLIIPLLIFLFYIKRKRSPQPK